MKKATKSTSPTVANLWHDLTDVEESFQQLAIEIQTAKRSRFTEYDIIFAILDLINAELEYDGHHELANDVSVIARRLGALDEKRHWRTPVCRPVAK
jgi:hypothetical protein